MAKETRYVATVTFYTYGNTDEEAFHEAQMICNNLKRTHDNRALVEQFHKQPFGTLDSTEININTLNLEDYEPEF